MVVVPARARKPRDKAKVETGVLLVERWILAQLRHQVFTSLTALNRAVRELLEDLNQRPFKKLPGCRRMAFETLNRPALRPLPATPYEYAEWKRATVHVELKGHYYLVPHALVGRKVDLRHTATTVATAQGPRLSAVNSPSIIGTRRSVCSLWPTPSWTV